jgi:nucleotide-binding universal stress UspA family protein
MYKKIMVPIDLAHSDRLGKALSAAADIARSNDAEVVYVAVAHPGPDGELPDREQLRADLDTFSGTEAAVRKLRASDHLLISEKPSADTGAQLVEAARDVGADLIVMASHVPGVRDHFLQSNAGYVASYAPVSVYVIR